jgi:ankyrin repeat protein
MDFAKKSRGIARSGCENSEMDELDAELRKAVKRSDVEAVVRLIGAGADIHYRDEHGYSAAIDAAYVGTWPDDDMIGLLELLIAHEVDLDTKSSYNESALGVMSRYGRFDRVHLLLGAGADPSPLCWTKLHEAVAIGTIDDVRREALPSALESADHYSRTAWLLAVLVGDREKAEFLLDCGSDPTPKVERPRPALFFAVDAGRADLVTWLLELGLAVDEHDDSGDSALHHAVAIDEPDCVDVLIAAGANVNAGEGFSSVLAQASSAQIVRRLLQAGADPANLSAEGARSLCGLDEASDLFSAVSATAFEQGRTRRFGIANPERINEPFWEAMIRSGISAYEASSTLGLSREGGAATWCAKRFGQTTTELPDGRVVQIGGEHEDFYDADFCIYNDVFVYGSAGEIEIFGYPEEVFPPTDFHTATLIGAHIYVIGSLGYSGTPRYAETPVFRLDTESMRMERLTTTGSSPGGIYKHRAHLIGDTAIRVTDGICVREAGQVRNTGEFVLDLPSLNWRDAY